MAPCNHQTVPPQVEPPAPTGTGNSWWPPDNAPARLACTLMQIPTGTLQDEEQFNLDDVSGSEKDYELPRSNHGTNANPTPWGGNNCN